MDKDRNVYRMASSGMGVWLSLQSSAVVRLFHATRYESLADVDMAPPVEKMLSGLETYLLISSPFLLYLCVIVTNPLNIIDVAENPCDHHIAESAVIVQNCVS